MANPYIKSPISYTGGKYKLLPQILPLFPQREFRVFWENFSGGCNIAQNIKAKSYICCDVIEPLQKMLTYLKDTDLDYILNAVDRIINYFELSKTNQEGFLKLREIYNTYPSFEWSQNVHREALFFTLICYSFNNQIRFNKNGEYNMPFGKDRSSFNEQLRKNLTVWHNAVRNKHIIFSTKDFRDTFRQMLVNGSPKDFCYLDPPYFAGSVATYNENGGWTENDERDLLLILDNLNEKNIYFGLSNVLSNKGKNNDILLEWINKNNYTVHHLNHTYGNCNYHAKDKSTSSTDEVFITNY